MNATETNELMSVVADNAKLREQIEVLTKLLEEQRRIINEQTAAERTLRLQGYAFENGHWIKQEL